MTALYIHFPWCLKKCPYCDFNSQPLPKRWEESRFVEALLRDFDADLETFNPAGPLTSIFLGGGTPSLLSSEGIARILTQVTERIGLATAAEVTLEANPGTFTETAPARWQEAGVNRVSLGIQSFDDADLRCLGRIYSAATAHRAIEACLATPHLRLNLDLMYGLPGQTLARAERDLETALQYDTGHLSCYQLGIEPGTPFASAGFILPDEPFELDWLDRQHTLMRQHGYRQYEISAWCRAGEASRHNLNYWRFGDYMGIGPGAHGKLTGLAHRVVRTTKEHDPATYVVQMNHLSLRPANAGGLQPGEVGTNLGEVGSNPLNAGLERRTAGAKSRESALKTVRSALRTETILTPAELRIEYLLNVLRLDEGFRAEDFQHATGQSVCVIAAPLTRAQEAGLLERHGDCFIPTASGRRLLDEWLLWFD